MPAKSVIQVRRDTAANWSSANPTLANGEMGYDTTNKLFKVGDGTTAWNSLPVMAQHNTGSAARPLLTDGAYLSGSGLVLSGLESNYASAPDSAALSITGDIDIKLKVKMTDWTPSTTTLVSKWSDSPGSYSFRWDLNSSGQLVWRWSADGTNVLTVTSSATGITDNTTKWVRVTMDVNDGAGNRVVKFYTGDDGTNWTQLGTTTTTAGTTSIYNNANALNVGTVIDGIGLFKGTIYRTIIQSAYDTADNTTSLQFDANFETQTADALAFTESSSNAATVTIKTTRYSYGIPNRVIASTTTSTFSASRDIYSFFTITKAIVVDMVQVEVTSSIASNRTMWSAIYATDDNYQPTGNVLVDFGALTLTANVTGRFSKQITPVTLQPGTYVIGRTFDGTSPTMRFVRLAGEFSVGLQASTWIGDVYADRTAAAFPNNPAPWNVLAATTGTGETCVTLLRWKAA